MNFKWEFHDLDKKKINIFYVLFKNIFKSKYIPQYMYANCFEKKNWLYSWTKPRGKQFFKISLFG